MKHLCLIMSIAAMLLIGADNADKIRWSFEDAAVAKMPEGWSAAKTGKGPGSVWKVIEDSSAPVLVQRVSSEHLST